MPLVSSSCGVYRLVRGAIAEQRRPVSFAYTLEIPRKNWIKFHREWIPSSKPLYPNYLTGPHYLADAAEAWRTIKSAARALGPCHVRI